MTARRRAWRRGGLLAPAVSVMLVCGTAAGCTSPEPEPEPQPVVSIPEGAVVHELRAGGSKFAFYIDHITFVKVPLGNLGEASPQDDIVPFGYFFFFTGGAVFI